MSHERSTPTSPAVRSTEDFSPNSSSHFARTSTGLRGEDVPITPLERWAMGREGDDWFRGLAGAAGGITSGFITCPLDVIKTKLQAQGGFRTTNSSTTSVVYRGLIGTGRVIWREEGLRGLYRGLGPIILGYLPTWAVWFTVYGRSKDYFKGHFENELPINFCSSIVAGACSTMVTNPIWVIKTRLMAQVSRKSTAIGAKPPWHYRSTLDAARKMYRSEGLLSFYSGLTPALLGLTHVAVQFPAYEFLRTKFTGLPMGVSPPGDQSSHWGAVFAASVLSKILASSATYPHEVIRTRLQTQQRQVPAPSSGYATFRSRAKASEGVRPATIITNAIPRYKGIVTTFKTILREEGWRAFYAGMGTNMMRAVPAATTTMLTYEFVMKQLQHAKSEGLRKSSHEL